MEAVRRPTWVIKTYSPYTSVSAFYASGETKHFSHHNTKELWKSYTMSHFYNTENTIAQSNRLPY